MVLKHTHCAGVTERCVPIYQPAVAAEARLAQRLKSAGPAPPVAAEEAKANMPKQASSSQELASGGNEGPAASTTSPLVLGSIGTTLLAETVSDDDIPDASAIGRVLKQWHDLGSPGRELLEGDGNWLTNAGQPVDGDSQDSAVPRDTDDSPRTRLSREARKWLKEEQDEEQAARMRQLVLDAWQTLE